MGILIANSIDIVISMNVNNVNLKTVSKNIIVILPPNTVVAKKLIMILQRYNASNNYCVWRRIHELLENRDEVLYNISHNICWITLSNIINIISNECDKLNGRKFSTISKIIFFYYCSSTIMCTWWCKTYRNENEM